MDLTVFNQSFEMIYILDTYESLVWVDKFDEPGTFEIYTPVTDDILTYLVKNNYLVNPSSDHMMIIEDLSLESNIEDGNKIKIVGRSLESILDRRIVWNETNFKENHNFQNAVKKLIERAFVTPEGKSDDKARRTVSNFIFQESNDERITSLKLEDGASYHGNNLLEAIQGLCTTKKVGFKITLSDENKFIFTLYTGTDRSYNQTNLPYVVFSPSFDNVISSNYKEENSKEKNIACVLSAANSEGDKEEIYVGDTTVTGLLRREMYIETTDISWNTDQEDDEGNKIEMSKSAYRKLMKQRGEKDLKKTSKSIKSFDGQCDTTRMYVYGTDFFMGDIVQMANEYGMETSSRITEFTWSCNTSEIETYPTFTAVDDEEES